MDNLWPCRPHLSGSTGIPLSSPVRLVNASGSTLNIPVNGCVIPTHNTHTNANTAAVTLNCNTYRTREVNPISNGNRIIPTAPVMVPISISFPVLSSPPA